MEIHELTPGEMSHRSGVAVSALHFYEREGLITSRRTTGNQRRYARETLRRVAFIRMSQRLGIPLARIREALATLPTNRVPTSKDWARLSAGWRQDLDDRILHLQRLRDNLAGCIGCGCLSLKTCALSNPGDVLAAQGPGAVRPLTFERLCDRLRVMELALQASLFEHAERRHLGNGAWVEVRSGWLADADSLFDELMSVIPWRAERRQMYDRVLDVPRLVSFHDLIDEPAPHPRLKQIRRRLNDTYGGELGEPFTTAGLCLYRDGNDSVAWHGDTIGRSSTEDTMVAIVSLGATRVFALRPRGGGRSLRLPHRAMATCW